MTQGSAKPETTSALQQALASVRQLKAVLQRHEEPIAIIGAACRLPGADSLETFWSLLTQQRDAIEEVPRAGATRGTTTLTRWPWASWLPAGPG